MNLFKSYHWLSIMCTLYRFTLCGQSHYYIELNYCVRVLEMGCAMEQITKHKMVLDAM